MADSNQDPESRLSALQALRWLTDMGADEMIGETAVNRYSDLQFAPAAPSPATLTRSREPAANKYAAGRRRGARSAGAVAGRTGCARRGGIGCDA